MNVIAWRAWYADGMEYTSAGHRPQALPADGVLAIRQWFREQSSAGRPYSQTLDGGDWYWWDGWAWRRVPAAPWGDHAPRPDVPCASCLKRGVGVSDDAFASLVARVAEATPP